MKRGHVPMRQCVACRVSRPQEDLIRLKVVGDVVVISEKSESVPGRGCYVCPREECIDGALKKGRLERAFRRGRLVPPSREQLLVRLEEKGKLHGNAYR
ncbi:MAG: YlxR family protein [Thermodesulfobacteriota bacterium]